MMDAATVTAARRFARECQVDACSRSLAALFQALLSRYSGQSDILFLTPHANRTENTEAVMGPLADPICLTAHIAADDNFPSTGDSLGRGVDGRDGACLAAEPVDAVGRYAGGIGTIIR